MREMGKLMKTLSLSLDLFFIYHGNRGNESHQKSTVCSEGKVL